MPFVNAEKQRAYVRTWTAKRRAEWLADKACVACGATEQLEVDHIDPAAKSSHRIWSWTKERRDAELAKCRFSTVRKRVGELARLGDLEWTGEIRNKSRVYRLAIAPAREGR